MQVFLILSLIIAALATIFAVQNAIPTTINFLVWEFEGSLALILLIALIAGAMISFFASLPTLIRSRLTISNLNKKLAESEKKIEQQEAQPATGTGKPAQESPIDPEISQ